MPDHGRPPEPGDLIWVRRRPWRVRSTTVGVGLHRVAVVSPGRPFADRTFLMPADTWTHEDARRTQDVSPRRAVAWLAACVARAHPAFTPATIVRANSTLLPYQLEPALAVLAGARRVLIADAVGLGKTVQAVLIVAELLARRPDARVLILVPAPLLAQWTEELAQRFSLTARSADAATFRQLRADQAYLSSPWNSAGIWLASPDFLKQPHVLKEVPNTSWDALVVDEAHTMAGDSYRRAAAHALALAARHVVLLTATPHDGDEVRFRRLLSIGAQGRADPLTVFRRTRLSRRRPDRRLHLRPSVAVCRALAAVDQFASAAMRSAARSTGAENHIQALHLICTIFRKRVLSSSAAFAASVERRLAIVEQQSHSASPGSSEAWAQLALFESDDMPGDEARALEASTGVPAGRELAWLRRLHHLASVGSRTDLKLARLSTLLRRANEPAIVFTEYRDSLQAAAIALGSARPVALLHGSLPPTEQRRAIRAFVEGRAHILLATDVASQGLNLQHRARWVINLDLPWTPVRLEQRAGRVDRIGQTRPVHITVITTRHGAEAAMHARLAERQDVSAAAALQTCTRWTRAARGLARLFLRQRALVARWRGPAPTALPRAAVRPSLFHRLCGTASSPATILEIPLMSADGTVLERVFAVEDGAVSDGADDAVSRRTRALDARLRQRRNREQGAVRQPGRPAAAQPGLFDARELLDARDQPAPNASRETALATASGVRAGRPRAVLVLEVRR